MVYRLQATIDDILRLIQNETSPLVINSGLTVVLKLASSVNDAVSNSRILILAKKVRYLAVFTLHIYYMNLPNTKDD